MRKWIPVEAAGEHPHSSGVVQVVDDKAFDSILAQEIPPNGLLLDFDHYSSLTEEELAKLKEMNIQLPSNAAGWIRRMAKRVTDGLARIWAEVDFTPEGERAIANKKYVWTSPVHPCAALENLGDGKVRPLAISKVALTNEPNIKAIGSILNRRGLLDLENSNPDEKWITINGRPVRIDENGEPDFGDGQAGGKAASGDKPVKRPISEWRPDRAKPHSDPFEARKRLMAGFKTKDVLGAEVQWDKSIIDHREAPRGGGVKNQADVRARLKRLDIAVDTVENPHEAWEENNKRTYLKLVSSADGKPEMMQAFVYDKENHVGSYYPTLRPKEWEKKRTGMLLYSRSGSPMVVKALEIESPAEDARDSIEKETLKRKIRMKEQIAKLLKLDPAAADDVIVEAVRALVDKEAAAQVDVQIRANELEAKTAEAASLKNRAEAAETELGTMKTAQAKAETDAKVTAELGKYPDLPNRAQAEGMLRADFDKGAAFLASLKIPGKVAGKIPDIENRAGEETNKPTGLARVIAAIKK